MPDMNEPLQGVIIQKNEDERLVFGWAYIAKDRAGNVVVDRQGDFIDEDEVLEKMAYDFVVDFAQGDVYHNENKVADLVESVVFTPEKIEKMGLPEGALPTGWWIGMKVTDDDTWRDIDKYPAFSIGGRGIKQKVAS